jgi:hypothetical protein
VVKDKRGLIRTFEAIIAVVIMLTLIYYLVPKDRDVDVVAEHNVREAQKLILTEISLNEEFRECVSGFNTFGVCEGGCMNDIDLFIDRNVPFGYESFCEICDSAISCTDGFLPVDKSIYTDSVFIAHDPSRIVRIYFWEK